PTLALATRLHYVAVPPYRAAWLFINMAVPSQVTGVVKRYSFACQFAFWQPRFQSRQQFAVMLNLECAAGLPPIRADGAHAMRADRNHPGHAGCSQRLDIALRQVRKRQIIAQPAGRDRKSTRLNSSH